MLPHMSQAVAGLGTVTKKTHHIQSTFVLGVCYVPKAVIGAGYTKYKNFKTGAVSNLVGNWMRGTGFVKPVQILQQTDCVEEKGECERSPGASLPGMCRESGP